MSDYAKRVNDRSLADINRVNAAFHSRDSEDAEKGKSKPLPGFKPTSKGAERTASERANVMAGKDPKAEDATSPSFVEAKHGQAETRMSAAEFHEHSKGVKVTRNAGGHEVVNPHPYKTGSNMPNWRAPKGSAFHVDGETDAEPTGRKAAARMLKKLNKTGKQQGESPKSQDVSHEGGKQIVKKKGQVVAQHDVEKLPKDLPKATRKEAAQIIKATRKHAGSKAGREEHHEIGMRLSGVSEEEIKRNKDSRDSFPATDKTIRDVNDANLAYYNNSPHAGMAQDAEPMHKQYATAAEVLSKQAHEHRQAGRHVEAEHAEHRANLYRSSAYQEKLKPGSVSNKSAKK